MVWFLTVPLKKTKNTEKFQSKCENLTLFSIEIWFYDTQNTFYLIVKGKGIA